MVQVTVCRGVHKEGCTPCERTLDLDALGYCPFHSPLALQCQGIARTTGERCRVRWGLDAHTLCRLHSDQSVRCHGLTANGERCDNTSDIDHHGFCPAHPPRAQDLLRDFALMVLEKNRPNDEAATMSVHVKTQARY